MRIQVIVSLLVASLVTVPSLLLGQGESEEAQLVVVGHGKVLADPDRAAVELGVTRRAHTARTAQEQVNQTVQLIISALSHAGINSVTIFKRVSKSCIIDEYEDNWRTHFGRRERPGYQ